jgi:hypothetical protein
MALTQRQILEELDKNHYYGAKWFNRKIDGIGQQQQMFNHAANIGNHFFVVMEVENLKYEEDMRIYKLGYSPKGARAPRKSRRHHASYKDKHTWHEEYLKMGPGLNFYEIFRAGAPQYLYFDLEWLTKTTKKVDSKDEMNRIHLFMGHVDTALSKLLGSKGKAKYVHIATSSRFSGTGIYKSSFHFKIADLMFNNGATQKQFFDHILNPIFAADTNMNYNVETEKKGTVIKCIVDGGPYGSNKSMRSEGSYKCDDKTKTKFTMVTQTPLGGKNMYITPDADEIMDHVKNGTMITMDTLKSKFPDVAFPASGARRVGGKRKINGDRRPPAMAPQGTENITNINQFIQMICESYPRKYKWAKNIKVVSVKPSSNPAYDGYLCQTDSSSGEGCCPLSGKEHEKDCDRHKGFITQLFHE